MKADGIRITLKRIELEELLALANDAIHYKVGSGSADIEEFQHLTPLFARLNDRLNEGLR